MKKIEWETCEDGHKCVVVGPFTYKLIDNNLYGIGIPINVDSPGDAEKLIICDLRDHYEILKEFFKDDMKCTCIRCDPTSIDQYYLDDNGEL